MHVPASRVVLVVVVECLCFLSIVLAWCHKRKLKATAVKVGMNNKFAVYFRCRCACMTLSESQKLSRFSIKFQFRALDAGVNAPTAAKSTEKIPIE
jgi:hypothetical protein